MSTVLTDDLRPSASSAAPDRLRAGASAIDAWADDLALAAGQLASATRHEVSGLAGAARDVAAASRSQRDRLERVAAEFSKADSVERLLGIALGEAGYVEGAHDSTKFGRWFGLNGNPWCAMFVSWAFAQAGTPLPAVNSKNGFASVQSGWNYAVKTQRRVWTPKPGDIFLIDHGGGKGHTGIVVSVDLAAGTMVTVEGNTNAAGARLGTTVRSKVRPIRQANRGFWRPTGVVEPEERIRPKGIRDVRRRRKPVVTRRLRRRRRPLDRTTNG